MARNQLLAALAISLPLVLCSCSSKWLIIDGHRNEATIEMGYRPHLFVPKPDTATAIALAGEKCKNWDFESAKVLSDPIKYEEWKEGDDMVIQKFQCVKTQGPPLLTNAPQ